MCGVLLKQPKQTSTVPVLAKGQRGPQIPEDGIWKLEARRWYLRPRETKTSPCEVPEGRKEKGLHPSLEGAPHPDIQERGMEGKRTPKEPETKWQVRTSH